MRNPFRHEKSPQNTVVIRSENGTIHHTIYLAPPTSFGENTCEIVFPDGFVEGASEAEWVKVERGGTNP